jgi:hypothetical protein
MITADSLEASSIRVAKALDVEVNGPRIFYGQGHFVHAKCKTGKHILRGGLGALGVGQMWFETTDDDRNAPEFGPLPVTPCEGCPADAVA